VTIWIVDAHRDGKRFVVRADEKLTAFLELESVIGGLRRLTRWDSPRDSASTNSSESGIGRTRTRQTRLHGIMSR
jgi:hypothetical protein